MKNDANLRQIVANLHRSAGVCLLQNCNYWRAAYRKKIRHITENTYFFKIMPPWLEKCIEVRPEGRPPVCEKFFREEYLSFATAFTRAFPSFSEDVSDFVKNCPESSFLCRHES